MHLSVPVDVQELPGEEDKLMEDKLEQRDESNPVSDSKLVGSVAVQQQQRSVLRHPDSPAPPHRPGKVDSIQFNSILND
jgi:hypothetical protein